MSSTTNKWNIQKAIKEYAKIANVFSVDIPFKQIAYPKQIKLRRLASVLGAFLNRKETSSEVFDIIDFVFGHVDNLKLFEESPINEEDKQRIFYLMGSSLSSSHLRTNLKEVTLSAQTRKTLFDMLLRYRVESEYLKTTFSTTIEANLPISLAINLCSSIYNESILECNEKLEQILVLILGENFKGSFSETELKDHFEFPLTTDEELLDWTIDNM